MNHGDIKLVIDRLNSIDCAYSHDNEAAIEGITNESIK